jgi:hypothetical protein
MKILETINLPTKKVAWTLNKLLASYYLQSFFNSYGPWIVLGDFNSILSQEDKHNGDPVSSYEVSDFRACYSDLGLSDLNYTGCHYTWSNGTIWTKIDRVLANPLW